jgi:transposase
MKIKETVGIDVSKSVIDLFIHGNKFNGVFKNSVKGYKEAIKVFLKPIIIRKKIHCLFLNIRVFILTVWQHF